MKEEKDMKALLVNGSPRANGNTMRALEEVASALRADGLETEIVQIGAKPVRGCIACRKCAERGYCVFSDDIANTILEKACAADALVLGTPVYYAQPNGALLAVMQRVFFAAGRHLRGKPAASVAVCRRGGASTAFQTMRLLGRNLAWMVKSLKTDIPAREPWTTTNFIR